jgi:hypothetical protein
MIARRGEQHAPRVPGSLVNTAHLPKLNDCRGREASSRLPFDGRVWWAVKVEGTTGRRWAAVAARMKEAAN